MSTHEDARLAYELAIGKRVSDAHWWRTRKLLTNHRLEITATNAQFLVALRKQIPKSAIGVSGLLDAYHRAESLTAKMGGTMTGAEVSNILLQFGITAHRTTISRWFKKAAGGYQKKRDYTPEEIKGILISAFLYKASQTGKLPQVS
ncbi:MAG: hypothetical protein F6J89_06335 [Symploca sp. SIO1C4]|uniref:Uncharacterized protein n=1 Tax=Symploca sp. SIO1C4 TaxID=2607765 RepID=A0A6B3NC93_9CYAN|nr:hypothetical protein [Symploca sp. SIO1C4]